ncbi:hypothetical protein GCM10007242_39180 [Pigmentiphaga litoralis]|jgi:hypothetical protein|uniref:hypothetical protein n=1 Tax=Pigmentiphaga litoralis TaxID=516702 RepID=UPI0016762832|nr:hypothetical protein [Pigmentiphaga litoralis]GGX28946.1 hypothetical protein GCM10007242_39180 [Pigmentiphaga litoralis]
MSDPRSRLTTRKELLLARASIERMEFAAHVGRVKSAATPSSLIRLALPARMLSQQGPAIALSLFQNLRRYPIVSSAVSMLLARVASGGVFKLAKLGGVAAVAMQAYKIWRAVNGPGGGRYY